MRHFRLAAASTIVALALVACDDDPSNPQPVFRVTCPTGPVAVNAPLAFAFTGPVASASVNSANIVVYDAVTGFEVPGALSVGTGAGASTVTFTQAESFGYDTRLRVRIQNVLRDTTNVAVTTQVCEFLTAPPPIAQVWWDPLPSATGVDLTGVSLISPDSGFVLSQNGTIFRRRAGDFEVVFNEPYYNDGRDIAFAGFDTGFAAHTDVRNRRIFILQTRDGGAVWDTIFSDVSFAPVGRLRAQRIGSGASARLFAVAGGGGGSAAKFWKYHTATNTFTTVLNDATYGGVTDIDWPLSDTLRLAATSSGVRFGLTEKLGQTWYSTNGGQTWTRITNGNATSTELHLRGVAVRANGEIWAVGGSGLVLRLTPAGAGVYTRTQVAASAFSIANPDPLDPEAMSFYDVQFAPDNDQKGWLVGAYRVGIVNGTPQYAGMIFETTNGGNTWIRQGVRGAEGFGASFPPVKRISVFNAANAWIIGDDGFAISYQP